MTDSRTEFEFGSNTQAHKMALLVHELMELANERKEFNAEWKERKTALEGELYRLKHEILTGQTALFPSPEPPGPPKEAA